MRHHLNGLLAVTLLALALGIIAGLVIAAGNAWLGWRVDPAAAMSGIAPAFAVCLGSVIGSGQGTRLHRVIVRTLSKVLHVL